MINRLQMFVSTFMGNLNAQRCTRYDNRLVMISKVQDKSSSRFYSLNYVY